MPLDEFSLLTNTQRTPHSPEAEQAVIGSMLIDPECVADVIGAVSQDDFYSALNRDIFSTIQSMFSHAQKIDPVTVCARMEETSVGDENAARYLLELMQLTPTSANVMEYAHIVRDKALLREIAKTGAEITELAVEGEGGAEAVLDVAESRVFSLRRETRGLEPISVALTRAVQQIHEAAKSGLDFPGLPTGLADLDNIIMGLNKSDVVIIASRPGMGKTSIALNIALHAARASGKAVVFFSIEMSSVQLALRLLSSESRIDSKVLQTGRVAPADWKSLMDAATEIKRAEIYINDNPSITVRQMNAQCRRVKNLGLVVIDYLQLIKRASDGRQGSAGETRANIVAEISRMIKVMAKELNVPVVCACQLNRETEKRKKEDRRPMLSDLAESGGIERDADIVLGLYRERDDTLEDINTAECIILKNRRGETGKVKLLWSPEFTTYSTHPNPWYNEDD